MRLQRLLGNMLGLGALLVGAGGVGAGCAGDPEVLPPAATDPLPPPPLTPAIRRVRRLSSREYNNVVRDLLGDTSRPAARFIRDAYQNGYDNGSAELAVQSDQVIDYAAAAEALAQSVVARGLGPLIADCDVAQAGDAACLQALLDSVAPRAFRRPLTQGEQQRLRAVFDAELFAGGDFARGIQTVLEVILQSPQFLYREELGPADAPAGQGPVRLTDYEVASELSFLLTGSLPDATLWAAVTAGRFKTVADYRREAERLLGTLAARETVRAFLHQWLATDRTAILSKDGAFYPDFNQALADSMGQELDRFYDHVMWDGSGSLRELFTSNQSFVDDKLARLYGVQVSGGGFQPVTLDPALRKGVLSRAGFLAVHAATDSSGPISRGVFLLQALLCLPPPQPPANVPPALPAGDPGAKDLTTRQRFEKHVASPVCAACHKQIDGVGFGLEQFDGIGAHRTVENGHPIDSRGTLLGTGEIDGDYTGAGELASRMAGSRSLTDCYLRNAYRFALGQIEPTGEDLRALGVGFSSDARLSEVLLTLIENPVFTSRSFEAVKP
ncbi:MAG TPA: DUF1592 domain-containing protein [Pseudomonadota bacterium]|nr:DUF1592 domain-containing protein [Pseudomonadota bacterium]